MLEPHASNDDLGNRSRWFAARAAIADEWTCFFLVMSGGALFLIASPLLGIRMGSKDEMPIWFQAILGGIAIGPCTYGFCMMFRRNYLLVMRGIVADAVVVSDSSPLGQPVLGKGTPRRGLRRKYTYEFEGKTYCGYTCSLLASPAHTGDILVDTQPDWTGREIEVLVDPKRPGVSRVLGYDVFLSDAHRKQCREQLTKRTRGS